MFKAVLAVAVFACGLNATDSVAQEEQDDETISATIITAPDAATVSCVSDTDPRARLIVIYSEKMSGVVYETNFLNGVWTSIVFMNGHIADDFLFHSKDRVEFSENSIVFDSGTLRNELNRHTLVLQQTAALTSGTFHCHKRRTP